MKITEWHDRTTWNQFVAGNSTPASFLQSWEWGEFQKSQGSRVLRLGFQPSGTKEYIRENLVATASVIKRNLPLPGMSFWYLPRGPIIRRDNIGSQQAVLENLLLELSNKKNVFLRLAPYWSQSDNRIHWPELDFVEPQILRKQREPEMTQLTSLGPPEEMLERMHQKTRYNIRLAERKGVEFRFYQDKEDLDIFWQLLNTTSQREKIRIYKKDYYTVLLMAARLLTDPQMEFKSDELHSILAFASYQGKVLAGGLWLGFGDTLTYLHGGSTREHKEVMAPYSLHWQLLQWGHEHGYQLYDWWGIEKKGSVFSLKGVTRFKQGFGGFEHSFAGTHDRVFNKKIFSYLTVLRKMKEIF
jgi:lipid II:glycine glycyltransferase (peptidoglycan interpeptide bridge formation enzyme)